MLTIIGLGNPGVRYRNTRHNTGFMVIDRMVNGASIRETRFGHGREEFLKVTSARASARYSRVLADLEGEIDGTQFVLVKPLTFMNDSGRALTNLRTRGVFKELRELLVISDDADLEVGRIRLREKGSAGGHNGLISIIEALGTEEFARLRIGVGPRPAGAEMVDYVLGEFAPEERTLLEPVLDKCARAATAWVWEGMAGAVKELATNQFQD